MCIRDRILTSCNPFPVLLRVNQKIILSALLTELKNAFVNSIVVDVSVTPFTFPLASTGAGPRIEPASTVFNTEFVDELKRLIFSDAPRGNPFFAEILMRNN